MLQLETDFVPMSLVGHSHILDQFLVPKRAESNNPTKLLYQNLIHNFISLASFIEFFGEKK